MRDFSGSEPGFAERFGTNPRRISEEGCRKDVGMLLLLGTTDDDEDGAVPGG